MTEARKKPAPGKGNRSNICRRKRENQPSGVGKVDTNLRLDLGNLITQNALVDSGLYGKSVQLSHGRSNQYSVKKESLIVAVSTTCCFESALRRILLGSSGVCLCVFFCCHYTKFLRRKVKMVFYFIYFFFTFWPRR